MLTADLKKAAQNLQRLDDEVLKILNGESNFTEEHLSGAIERTKDKQQTLKQQLQAVETELANLETQRDAMSVQYERVMTWTEIYNEASVDEKRLIISKLIRRVNVSRDYYLEIDFNVDLESFNISKKDILQINFDDDTRSAQQWSTVPPIGVLYN